MACKPTISFDTGLVVADVRGKRWRWDGHRWVEVEDPALRWVPDALLPSKGQP